MGPLAPSRKSDMARVAVRALVAGTVACFMTACIAGEICFFCCFIQTDSFWNHCHVFPVRGCKYGLYRGSAWWTRSHGPRQIARYVQDSGQDPCCWDCGLFHDCMYGRWGVCTALRNQCLTLYHREFQSIVNKDKRIILKCWYSTKFRIGLHWNGLNIGSCPQCQMSHV